MVSKSQLLRTINEEESMKNYTGKGLIRINNNEEIQVEYDIGVSFNPNGTIQKLEANLIQPQEVIENIYGVTGTLILKGGQEIDFFGAGNGKLTPINYGNALRNFSLLSKSRSPSSLQ